MNAIKNRENYARESEVKHLQNKLQEKFAGKGIDEYYQKPVKKDSLVVFDFDETLVESRHIFYKVNKKAMELLNLPHDEVLPSNIFQVFDKKYLGWGKNLEEQIDIYKNKYSVLIDQLMRQKEYVKATKFFSGMIDVIRQLSKTNVALAVASSRDLESIINVLKYNGVINDFAIVEATYGGRKFNDKPDTHIVDYISTELGIPLNRSVMIGDSPCDVIMGKDAGMKTIAIGYGRYNKVDSLEELQPNALLRSSKQINEIPSIIKGLINSAKVR